MPIIFREQKKKLTPFFRKKKHRKKHIKPGTQYENNTKPLSKGIMKSLQNFEFSSPSTLESHGRGLCHP